jgi:hypothetical protein
MKLRNISKFAIAAALGLAFSALAANAQLLVLDVRSQATFGPFIGGAPNSVTNNGGIDMVEVISTGIPLSDPFTITYTPFVGAAVLDLSLGAGTLDTGTFLFDSPQAPASYFTSVGLVRSLDFDNDGIWDLTSSFTLNLSAFTAPNGLTGVNYSIVPSEFYGLVNINGDAYSYAAVVSGDQGTLFDGSNNIARVQFQFIATPVPEPSTYALFGVMALGGIVLARRRFSASKIAKAV